MFTMVAIVALCRRVGVARTITWSECGAYAGGSERVRALRACTSHLRGDRFGDHCGARAPFTTYTTAHANVNGTQRRYSAVRSILITKY